MTQYMSVPMRWGKAGQRERKRVLECEKNANLLLRRNFPCFQEKRLLTTEVCLLNGVGFDNAARERAIY